MPLLVLRQLTWPPQGVQSLLTVHGPHNLSQNPSRDGDCACGAGRVPPDGTRLGLQDEAMAHQLVSVLPHDGVPLRGRPG